MNNQNFGAALRTDRTSMGFTQEEFCSAFSKFTGMPIQQQALARWSYSGFKRGDEFSSCAKHGEKQTDDGAKPHAQRDG